MCAGVFLPRLAEKEIAMKVCRKGVFETNSSSTHSISIASGDFVPAKFPIEGGVCKVFPGKFGWEFMDYTMASVKASYCLTYVKTGGDPDGQLGVMLKEVLGEVTGRNVVFMQGVTDNDLDYIDHQSFDACKQAFASKDTLRAFIFNPKSVLRTGNDNG